MKRKNFYLSNLEIQMLEMESERLDISMSDLLRRILDKHFEDVKLETTQIVGYEETSVLIHSGVSSK